jgi:hypothetical protein
LSIIMSQTPKGNPKRKRPAEAGRFCTDVSVTPA